MSDPQLVIRCLGSQSYTRVVNQSEYDFVKLHCGVSIEVLSTTLDGIKAHHLLFPTPWLNDNWSDMITQRKKTMSDHEIEMKKAEDENQRIKQLQLEGRHCMCYDVVVGNEDYDDDTSYSPQEFIDFFKPDDKSQIIISSLQEGNVIDTEGYRGQGTWYFDGTRLHKSLGEYGYTLPPQAFAMVEKHGLSYFGDYVTGCEIVAIPSGLTLTVNGNQTVSDGSVGLSIENGEDGDDTLIINGKSYQTYYYDPYP